MSPDTMEGPTPISPLIHTVTMLTTGIFMIVRCSLLFEYSPTTLIVIIFTGVMMSFFAAITRVLYNNLKIVITYSTCS